MPQPHPLERFIGQQIVITTLAGTIISGQLVEIREGYAYLEGGSLIGTKHKAIVGPLLLYLRRNISHVHPAPTALAPVDMPL